MKHHYINSGISKHKNKKSIKFGWILILLIILFLMSGMFSAFDFDDTIVIESGDTFSKFIVNMPKLRQVGLKLRVRSKDSLLDISKIAEGSYVFSGRYTQNEFLYVISEGPKSIYQKYTVLEGWSIYDIDYDLTKKGLINEGEYINFVTDSVYIGKYQNRYEFLAKAGNITSMEGFLYPDTYHLDKEGNIVDQLVYLQLENFKSKVWDVYSAQISSFSKLDWYDTVKLASIVEKEEKSNTNRPIVAGIFINRLDKNMLLGADITLCYGLHQPYETCTPSIIAKKVSDKSNIYNTRQNSGLTPQPISNPCVDSISSVINYSHTDYLYYLHDDSGVIHYGRTLNEHNVNRNKYL